MSKDKTFGEVLNDFIKEPKRNYKLHYVYTNGTDDFDRYDEMEEVDVFFETSEEVLEGLIKRVEMFDIEYYGITDLNRGIHYKDVSSFIADYLPEHRRRDYWKLFSSRGIDTAGCKAHLYDEVPNDKGSDRPIELPQVQGFQLPSGTISIELDVDKTELKDLNDCAIMLVDEINKIDRCNQEPGSIKHDLALMNRLLKFIKTAIDYKEKSQKEDEDYQLYLKLKERFEGGK